MRCTATYEVERRRQQDRAEPDLRHRQHAARRQEHDHLQARRRRHHRHLGETSYGINGCVTGSASPGKIQALVQSTDKRFNARVNVTTRGGEQTVTISPQDIDVAEVEVTLRRTG